MSDNQEIQNEIEESKELWELSNPSERLLFKSKYLMISNLNSKMTATQNILLSLCFLHAKIEGKSAKAEFDINEVIELTNNNHYKRYTKEIITKDRTVVSTTYINLVDDETVSGTQLVGETIQIFSKIRYEKGKYTAYFNTSMNDDEESDIVKLLRSKEQNPVIYNLEKFAKLRTVGQILYEHLLIASSYGHRELVLSVEDLAQIFKATSDYASQFKVIRYKYLAPAIEDINTHTNLDVQVNYIKSGRSVTHVSLVWLVDKVELPPTEKQVVYMKELYVKLSKLNLTDEEDLELLKKLKTGQRYTRNEAGALIARASYLEKSLISQNKSLKPIGEIEQQLYSDFFSNFDNIVPKMRNDILTTIQEFPDSERENLLKYAYELFLQNNGNSIGYIVEVLQEWLNAGVTNLTEALKTHDENYGPTYGVVPKDVKVSLEFKNAMDLWKD